MMGSRVGRREAGRKLVMPPGAPLGSMGPSVRHGARTSILDLDYSAKVPTERVLFSDALPLINAAAMDFPWIGT